MGEKFRFSVILAQRFTRCRHGTKLARSGVLRLIIIMSTAEDQTDNIVHDDDDVKDNGGVGLSSFNDEGNIVCVTSFQVSLLVDNKRDNNTTTHKEDHVIYNILILINIISFSNSMMMRMVWRMR